MTYPALQEVLKKLIKVTKPGYSEGWTILVKWSLRKCNNWYNRNMGGIKVLLMLIFYVTNEKVLQISSSLCPAMTS